MFGGVDHALDGEEVVIFGAIGLALQDDSDGLCSAAVLWPGRSDAFDQLEAAIGWNVHGLLEVAQDGEGLQVRALVEEGKKRLV